MFLRKFEVPKMLYPALLWSVLSIGLLLVRIVMMQSSRFSFMAWNLGLAWIPIIWVFLLVRNVSAEGWMAWKSLLFGLLWLLFLPNSFYLVTDFIHLKTSSSDHLVLDAVVIMSFAVSGLVLGCMSVYIVHRQLEKRLDQTKVWAVLIGIFGLSSMAIYLGRYLGWNSWDMIINPLFILFDLSRRLTNAETATVTLGTTLLFLAFISTAYASFYFGLNAVKKSK